MDRNGIARNHPASLELTEHSRRARSAGTGIRWWSVCAIVPLLALALTAGPGVAQNAFNFAPADPDLQDALHAMSRLAGVIFAGKVIAIHRNGGSNGAEGIVEIEFAIEDSVRGVSGNSYTLREWGGLWSADGSPFRVGQRYLVLLHTPGASGLSSPVGGADGAIPIGGTVQPAPQQAVASARVAATQADNSVVDLRWIATRVERSVSYRVNVLPARPAGPAHPSAVLPRRATPGSTLKPLLLEYALEHGIVHPQTEVYCRRNFHVGAVPSRARTRLTNLHRGKCCRAVLQYLVR